VKIFGINKKIKKIRATWFLQLYSKKEKRKAVIDTSMSLSPKAFIQRFLSDVQEKHT